MDSMQRRGYAPQLHFLGGTFPGRVKAIHNMKDKSRNIIKKKPEYAQRTDVLYTMTITSIIPHTIEPFAKNPSLGSFFLSANRYITGSSKSLRMQLKKQNASELVGYGIVIATVPSNMNQGFASVKKANPQYLHPPLKICPCNIWLIAKVRYPSSHEIPDTCMKCSPAPELHMVGRGRHFTFRKVSLGPKVEVTYCVPSQLRVSHLVFEITKQLIIPLPRRRLSMI